MDSRLLSYREFVKLVELRKTHKTWLNMKFIQLAKLREDKYSDVVRVKFDLKTCDSNHLKRCENEIYMREGKLPSFSEQFVSVEQE